MAARSYEPDKQPDWVLVDPVESVEDLQTIVNQLYEAARAKRKYSFTYSAAGALSPIARLNATTATVVINEDHQLVQEFSEKPESKRLLEALVVAETLLEVYLRAAHVESEVIRELLERNVSMLAAEVSREPKFDSVKTDDIRQAVVDLSHASRGMLHVTENGEVVVLGSLDEMERRVTGVVGGDTTPRRLGTFRKSNGEGDHQS